MKMNVNKCLPQELTIDSVEDILHSIGFTLKSTKSYPKRRLFFNPFIIFIILLLFTSKEVLIISLHENNDLVFKMLGSMGYLLGIREHYTIFYIIISSLPLCLQIIYYYNYRNGIKPTFLRVFQMMSGLVSPKSLGLTDEQQIRKLVKRTKFMLKCLHFNNHRIFPIIGSFLLMFLYSMNETTNLMEILVYGIPNAIFTMLWAVHMSNFIFYQFLLIFIISSYLKLKINSLNESLLEMKRRKRFIRIRETLQSFDSLYSEINEYNTTFWSKILFSFWNLFGTAIVVGLYIIIFVKVKILVLVIIIYGECLFISVYLFLIFTASSVTICAKKSYKTLISTFISYSKHKEKHFLFRIICSKIKVKFQIELTILNPIWKLFKQDHFHDREIGREEGWIYVLGVVHAQLFQMLWSMKGILNN